MLKKQDLGLLVFASLTIVWFWYEQETCSYSSIVEVPAPHTKKCNSKFPYSSCAIYATEIASVGAVAFTVVIERHPGYNRF